MLRKAVAVLVSSQSGERRTIPPRLLIGRSPACGLKLDERHVSGEHATIAWTGHDWEVRDLGSRNGTFVDGVRIESGQNVRLLTGTKLAFGDLRTAWTIADNVEPSIMAVHHKTRQFAAGQNDLLVLPKIECPEVSIYADSVGRWWMDDGTGSAECVQDQETITTSEGDWTVLLPSVPEGTPIIDGQLPFDALEFRFEVSRCEERVRMTVSAYGIEKQLSEREHGYLILTLARARQEDAGLPVDQRGWRSKDVLERKLRLDGNALNVGIHRARQQLSEAGIQGAAGLVEVRPRQRRLGTDRFTIGPWCIDAE